jgi:putative ABC transport system permease protein
MALMRNVAAGLRTLFRKEQADAELDEEVHDYLDAAVAEKIRRGMSQEEARRAARLEMGSADALKEEVHSVGWESVVETSWQDVRFALRLLRKSPGFTAIAVVTLAFGIGANTAIFSIIDAALLNALPYPNANRFVVLNESLPKMPDDMVSWPDFLDWRAQSRVFDAMAAY